MIPVSEGLLDEDHVKGEIGEVLAGEVPGRLDEVQITVYKSLGLVAQDLYAAQYTVSAAGAEGRGWLADF